MKDELTFKVSSELKNILGRDLITDDNIAVLELVKNCYDAHATKVDITFEDDGITIADNGKGMTQKDLIDKWLFVGFSAKRDNTEDESYRANFKRNYAGAKGIGRLSCDRLARYVQLTTKSDESDTTEILNVDWENFEKNQREEFDDIRVEHVSTVEAKTYPLGYNTGTILKLTGLHKKWDRNSILYLKRFLEKMINPFQGVDNFSIELIVPSLLEKDRKIREELDKSVNDASGEKSYSAKETDIVNGIIQNTIADVLKIKTTQIESYIRGNVITTRLTDRGELMYEIEEDNTFEKLKEVSINIYFLNRSAKYNFSIRMGMPPVQYGNIFLFRNGIRILPYGEPDNDSWGLNHRAQQGYHRFLSTRDLFGRVDVETDNLNDFKEVSSRDGGLINNKSTSQLMDFFNKIHRRLERYVVGVLWGEGFLKNDYFKNKDIALKTREKLHDSDKDSSNVNAVYDNIGSRVDYLQLIKSLVNDSSVRIIHYNDKLADIVNDVNAKDIIRGNLFDDLKKVADKTHNSSLINQLNLYQQKVEELKKDRETAEKLAEEQREKADLEKKRREEEERKRIEEESKRKKAEDELRLEREKNTYLMSSSRDLSEDAKGLVHNMKLTASKINSCVNNLYTKVSEGPVKKNDILKSLGTIRFQADKALKISKIITRANFKADAVNQYVDVEGYIKQYIGIYKDIYDTSTMNFILDSDDKQFMRKVRVLDIAVVLDDLISNSEKAKASDIFIKLEVNDNCLKVLFSDNGIGVPKEFEGNSERIFQLGVTSTNGSGIGLYMVRKVLKDNAATIDILGNSLFLKGATFQIIFQ